MSSAVGDQTGRTFDDARHGRVVHRGEPFECLDGIL
jgi:hypothetical protein